MHQGTRLRVAGWFLMLFGVSILFGSAFAAATGKPKGPKPDLAAVALGDPPPAAAPGTSFSVTGSIKNRGKGSARASKTGLYLSLDRTRDPGDVALGSFSVPKLKKGKSSALRTVVRIPPPTAAGAYFLIACVDVFRTVAETNEHANCRAFRLDCRDRRAHSAHLPRRRRRRHAGRLRLRAQESGDTSRRGRSTGPCLRRLELRRHRRQRRRRALRVGGRRPRPRRRNARRPSEHGRGRGARRRPAGQGRLCRRGHLQRGSGVALAANVGIYGGYDPATWSRSGAGPTTIVGSPQGVLADSVTGATLQLLSIHSTADLAGSAYGVRAVNGSALVLEGDQIVAGAGTDGTAGSAGSAGPGAGNGGNGSTTVFGTAGTSPAGATGGSRRGSGHRLQRRPSRRTRGFRDRRRKLRGRRWRRNRVRRLRRCAARHQRSGQCGRGQPWAGRRQRRRGLGHRPGHGRPDLAR